MQEQPGLPASLGHASELSATPDKAVHNLLYSNLPLQVAPPDSPAADSHCLDRCIFRKRVLASFARTESDCSCTVRGPLAQVSRTSMAPCSGISPMVASARAQIFTRRRLALPMLTTCTPSHGASVRDSHRGGVASAATGCPPVTLPHNWGQSCFPSTMQSWPSRRLACVGRWRWPGASKK